MGSAHVTMWTEETVAILRKHHAEGLSASQIARQIGNGCTRNAVIGKLHRLGMVRTPDAKSITISLANSSRARAAKPGEPSRPRIGIAGRGATYEQAPDVPMPKLRDAAATGEPARIMDAHFGGCRWPINDPGKGFMDETRFCCGKRKDGSNYCAAHHAIGWVKPPKTANELARSLRRFA